jgi:hypothetical protein
LKTITKNAAVISVLILLGVTGFYKFMTYDRVYSWSKEIEDEIKVVASKHNLKIANSEIVDVDNIKLPTERRIKVGIQKFLSKFDLMNYGGEMGYTFLLSTINENEYIKCKAWCLGDHVIGIEIEHKNLKNDFFNKLKKEFGDHFNHYKIVWTEL